MGCTKLQMLPGDLQSSYRFPFVEGNQRFKLQGSGIGCKIPTTFNFIYFFGGGDLAEQPVLRHGMARPS